MVYFSKFEIFYFQLLLFYIIKTLSFSISYLFNRIIHMNHNQLLFSHSFSSYYFSFYFALSKTDWTVIRSSILIFQWILLQVLPYSISKFLKHFINFRQKQVLCLVSRKYSEHLYILLITTKMKSSCCIGFFLQHELFLLCYYLMKTMLFLCYL